MVDDCLPARFLDCRLGPIGVVEEPSGRQPQQIPVPMTVQLDPMSGGDDVGDERRAARHLLADEEEGGGCTRLAQDLEHRRGPQRMRAVVEGERHTPGIGLPVKDSKRFPDSGRDGGGRRTGMDQSAGSAGDENRSPQLRVSGAVRARGALGGAYFCSVGRPVS